MVMASITPLISSWAMTISRFCGMTATTLPTAVTDFANFGGRSKVSRQIDQLLNCHSVVYVKHFGAAVARTIFLLHPSIRMDHRLGEIFSGMQRSHLSQLRPRIRRRVRKRFSADLVAVVTLVFLEDGAAFERLSPRHSELP